MSDKPQVVRIPVSPIQRYVIHSLMLEPGPADAMGRATAPAFKITSVDESTKHRRFTAAFALKVISKVGKKHGAFRVSHMNDETPKMMEVTIENVEFGLNKIATLPRNAAQDEIVGPLFDIFDLVKTGKYDEKDYVNDDDGNPVAAFDSGEDRQGWEPDPEDLKKLRAAEAERAQPKTT